ncbi:MAG: AzlC family ABC transporter permease [Pseudomonadota bacterium]|nr:AzlC family ABC transporter permease [Pseudomonadota bacterium]
MSPLPPDTRPAIRQGLMVGFATGLYGTSFGALAVAAGLDVWQAVALSALLFSGGSQFALIGVIASGGAGAAAVAASTLLGLRNGFYGVQMARMLKPRGVQRAVAAQLTIDESTAVALSQPTPERQRAGFWATGWAVFVFWNAMTLAGALLGNALGDPKVWGLDAAAAGAFLALLWPRLATRAARVVATGAAAVALLATPWVPPGIPILLTALVAVAAGMRPRMAAMGEAAATTMAGDSADATQRQARP